MMPILCSLASFGTFGQGKFLYFHSWSVRFCSVRFGSGLYDLVLFCSIRFCSVRFGSILYDSDFFKSAELSSLQFIPVSTVHLRYDFGWLFWLSFAFLGSVGFDLARLGSLSFTLDRLSFVQFDLQGIYEGVC